MAQGAIRLSINNRELKKSINQVRRWGGKTLDACDKEVLKATVNTAADAQQNIKDNGSIATSNLINSISSRMDKIKNTGFVSVNAVYGAAVEFGRKAGGMPPIAPLITWVKKKGLAEKPKEITSIAYAIAKTIAKNGTTAKPFLIPAWKRNAARLQVNLRRVLRESGKFSKP